MDLFDAEFFENQYTVVFAMDGEQKTERLMAPVFTLNTSFQRKCIFRSQSAWWTFSQNMNADTNDKEDLKLEVCEAVAGGMVKLDFIGAVKI